MAKSDRPRHPAPRRPRRPDAHGDPARARRLARGLRLRLHVCCDVSQPTVSHHLKVLRDAGAVAPSGAATGSSTGSRRTSTSGSAASPRRSCPGGLIPAATCARRPNVAGAPTAPPAATAERGQPAATPGGISQRSAPPPAPAAIAAGRSARWRPCAARSRRPSSDEASVLKSGSCPTSTTRRASGSPGEQARRASLELEVERRGARPSRASTSTALPDDLRACLRGAELRRGQDRRPAASSISASRLPRRFAWRRPFSTAAARRRRRPRPSGRRRRRGGAGRAPRAGAIAGSVADIGRRPRVRAPVPGAADWLVAVGFCLAVEPARRRPLAAAAPARLRASSCASVSARCQRRLGHVARLGASGRNVWIRTASSRSAAIERGLALGLGARRLGRIVDAPVERLAAAREHRARRPRPVADRDHVVEALAEELADRLRPRRR